MSERNARAAYRQCIAPVFFGINAFKLDFHAAIKDGRDANLVFCEAAVEKNTESPKESSVWMIEPSLETAARGFLATLHLGATFQP
jgi:hypothetical protein